jgi:hypothetical protein
MSLALTVVLLVTGVTVITGIIGFLIDRSAERHERREGR